MKKQLTVGLAALWLAAWMAPAAWAATIVGTVVGPDGAPLRAAFVRVQNTNTKITMMVLSDREGKYWTDWLDPGTYEVTRPPSATRAIRSGGGTSPWKTARG